MNNKVINKIFLLLIICCCLSTNFLKAQVQNDTLYFNQLRFAKSAYEEKNYELAIRYSINALKLDTSDVNLYNLACYYTLSDKKDSAFYYLNKSLFNSWNNCYWIKSDTDLDNLRTDVRWKNILHICDESNKSKSNIDSMLGNMLLEMRHQGQLHRLKVDSILNVYGDNTHQMDSLRDLINVIDKRNEHKLDSIIEKRGIPGKSLVGAAYRSTFLIIQHSNGDKQLEYYKQLERAVAKGEFPKNYLAYLTDRILMNQEKDQLFGTQLRWNSEIKNYELYPVENIVNIEVRRTEYGLISIQEYLSRYDIEWKQ